MTRAATIAVLSGNLPLSPQAVQPEAETDDTASEEPAVAAVAAVEAAGKSLRDLRIARVDELDRKVENGKVAAYRAKVRLSFKFEPGG